METNSCQIENRTENESDAAYIHRVTSNRSLANLEKWEVVISM